MLQEKITKIQEILQRDGQEYLLLGNFGHQISDDLLYWLLLEKIEYGYMLIPASGKPTLYAISFEVEQLKHKRDEYITILPAGKSVQDTLAQLFADTQVTLAIRPNALPAGVYQKIITNSTITPQPIMGEEHLMMVKLPKEISRMRQAAKLTDIIFAELLKEWPQFYTEADAANYLLQLMAARGVEPSFSPIIASGKHAANPHHRPTYDQLQTGFCVIDFGVRFKGYCSDMTRTIFIGSPSREEKKVYAHILDAQEKTIQQITPNKSVHELDEYCRDTLGEELAHYFIHSLGHGVGSQVHEFPSVSNKSAALLEQHMVIAIEPGVYIPDQYGIRIEDDVLITADGYEVLTKTNKTLLSV